MVKDGAMIPTKLNNKLDICLAIVLIYASEPKIVMKKLPCTICKETGHANLFGCKKFKDYLPGGKDGSKSLPKKV